MRISSAASAFKKLPCHSYLLTSSSRCPVDRRKQRVETDSVYSSYYYYYLFLFLFFLQPLKRNGRRMRTNLGNNKEHSSRAHAKKEKIKIRTTQRKVKPHTHTQTIIFGGKGILITPFFSHSIRPDVYEHARTLKRV